MKNICFIALVLLFSSCTSKEEQMTEKKRIIYTGYYIPVEGGSIEMKLDSVSLLNTLVNSLETDYKLLRTGKAYWIGYNNTMFSIAVHSDEAVDPLMAFIDTTTIEEAKYAAIYTIHLIGIDCQVQGRIYEEFNNKKARNALLTLLNEEELQFFIMELLVRDPWFSDIPILINRIEKAENDSWILCNSLQNYFFLTKEELPVNINLTKEMHNYYIEIDRKPAGYSEKDFYELVFSSFLDKYKDQIMIEDTLYNYNFHHSLLDKREFSESENHAAYASGKGKVYINMNMLLHPAPPQYFIATNNIFYSAKNDKLYIISVNTAKQMWVNWWKSKPESYRNLLEKSNISGARMLHYKHDRIMKENVRELYQLMKFKF